MTGTGQETPNPGSPPAPRLAGAGSTTSVADSRRCFDAVAGLVPVGVLVGDREGNATYANGHLATVFGAPCEELLGQGWLAHLSDRLRRELVASIRGGRVEVLHRFREEIRRRDGGRRWGNVHLQVLARADGGGAWFAVTVADTTALVESEDKARQATESEHRERENRQAQRLESLGQLAGGIAHDFNNLLGVILNYGDFLDEHLSDAAVREGTEVWAEPRSDLAQIRRAATRAHGLTRQLLAFGRRDIAQPRVLRLNDLVRDFEPTARDLLGPNITYTTALATGLWPVRIDPAQMRQVLVNVLGNAADATPDGGTVRIDTENVTIDRDFAFDRPGVEPGDYARIRISDNGAGMPKDVLDLAFEPFFTTKPKATHPGLGLATVYGIVAQAGGTCRLYSEPGHGTAFSALLPVATQPAGHPAAPAPAQEVQAGQTILVVEDEDGIREAARRILSRHGYQVLVTADGPEAVDLASGYADEIHLLLTDVLMPSMNGAEVAAKIRAIRPDTPVLYMSGYAQPILAAQGTLDPGVTLVEKPFSEPVLLDKVREALAGDQGAGVRH